MKKSKLINKILIAATILTLTSGLVACSNGAKNSKGDGKTELVMGLDDTFVPMGFKDNNGELVGFDIDLAKAVEKKLGKKIKFQSIDWSMKESELNNGNIDLIWNGYSVTAERKTKVDFSDVYLNNRQVIITLADSKINSKKDLAGAKVGAQNQSSSVDAINADKETLSKFNGGKVITYETNNDALMDLESKRIDAVVADEILARYYIKGRGESKYKVLKEDFGNESYAVGIKKGNTQLLNDFNKALKEVIKDGTAGEISKKWFGQDIVVK